MSPFETSMALARTWAHRRRILPVVLRPHKPWWNKPVLAVPAENLVEQPFDRGSAPGILLAVLRIIRRDPGARVILLSEGCEHVPARRVAEALERIGPADEVLMVAPSQAGRRRGAVRRAPMALRRIREEWRIIMEAGHVRAGGLVVASARALHQLFIDTQPELVEQFMSALVGPSLFDGMAMDQLYPFLPDLDFQAEVLARGADALTALVDETPRTVNARPTAVSV